MQHAQSDLQRAIRASDGSPALRRAIFALLERLPRHARQPTGEAGVYLEISIGYLAKLADVGWGTARRAWCAVHGCLHWMRTTAAGVLELGLRLRQRIQGQRWGQHLLLPVAALRAAAEALRWAERTGLYVPPPTAEAEPGEEWAPVRLERRGRHVVTRCPFHDDRHPSMLINVHASGDSGHGVCFACWREDGTRLSVYARRSPGGEWLVRRSLRTPCNRSAHVNDQAQDEGEEKQSAHCGDISVGSGMDTIDNPHAVGAYVLGRLDGWGLEGRTASGDLLSVLERAEARADAGESVARTAEAIHGTIQSPSPVREYLPDRLISTGRMRPGTWRQMPGGGWIPGTWLPTVQDWILLDLDGLESSPSSPQQVQALCSMVQAMCRADPGLAGAWAAVRTSGNGVQVWLKLSAPMQAAACYSLPRLRWMQGLARQVQQTLQQTGCGMCTIDRSAWSPGRYGRRPGYRLLSNGDAYRSTLIGSAAGSAHGQ